MKILKRAICGIAAAATFAASAAGIYIVHADDTDPANIAMLESILNGSRGYVIDTLINDDLSTNPQAKVSYISNQSSMMSDILSRYSNKDDPNYNMLYTIAVDLMFAVYNIDDWATEVANTVTEMGADAVESFGGEAAVSALLSDCVQSSKSQRLDSILQEVISADYTSSAGVSINDNDAQLTNIRRISDAAHALDALNSHLKSLTGLDQDTADSTAAYLNNVLIPVADSYDEAVRSFGDMVGAKSGIADEGVFELSKALAVAAMYETNVISEETAGETITEIAPSFLLDEVSIGLIGLGSNITKFASSSIDTYTYIKSIQTQKDTLAGPLKRAASYIGENDSADVLNKYARLIESAGDEKTAQYEWVIQTLKDKGFVESFTKNQVKKGLATLRDRLMPLYNESIIPSKISALTGVMSVTHAVADKATNVKSTVLKTYELKETSALMNCFIQAYYDDLAAYYSDKTDENAKKVLYDLAFIQRIRLRGETVAYRMTRDQLTAPLGQLLSGGCDSLEYYEQNYQDHIDALITASVCPVTDKELTVASGTTLEINYNEDYGGLYGVLTDTSGKRRGIAEISMQAVNGINVQSGGTLKLYVSLNDVTIPYITGSGGTIEWYMPQFKVADLEMSGGTLDLKMAETYAADAINISSSEIISNGSHIDCGSLQLKNISSSLLNLSVSGACVLSGEMPNVSLNIENNDIQSSSASVKRLEMLGKSPQSIYGDITAESFINNNTSAKGVILEGTLNVSRIANQSNVITNSGNVILSGSFIGDRYIGDIQIKSLVGNMPDISGIVTFIGDAEISNSFSAQGIKINSAKLTVNSVATLTGEVTVSSGELEFNDSDLTIQESLSLANSKLIVNNTKCLFKRALTTSGNVTLTNSTIETLGGFNNSGIINIDTDSVLITRDFINGGTLTSSGRLVLYGDVQNDKAFSADSLELAGNTSQTISGDSLHAENVIISGKGSITLGTDINYSGSITGSLDKVVNPERLIRAIGDNISDENLHLNEDMNITDSNVEVRGDLYINNGNINITNGALKVTGTIVLEKGDISADNSTINVGKNIDIEDGSISVSGVSYITIDGSYNQQHSGMTIGESSEMLIAKYAQLPPTMTVDGKLILANDSVKNSGTISGSGILELRCDLYAPNISIADLQRLDITGKTPQEINCSSIKCGDLNIDNNSRRGVAFENDVYYSGSYTPNASVVTGTVTQEVQ